MQYLTRLELGRINARANYTRRKLTPLEQVIKHIITVAAWPHSNQVEKQNKEAEVEMAIHCLQEHSTNESLWAKARLAMYNPAALQELVEGYPYVQFESIFNGTYHFSMIEQVAMDGWDLEGLTQHLMWLGRLVILGGFLPKGVETYISTKHTDYEAMRMAWVKNKETKYLGYTLNAETQEHVNKLFSLNGGGYERGVRAVRFIKDYKLLELPSIWKRTNMEHIPETMKEHGLQINIVQHVIHGKTVDVVELIQESTKTKLYFCF